MIGSTRQVTVYAYSQPADLRRGFDGLSALVREAMGRDELSGDLYVFVSRDRRRAKVLLWDGTGLCVYAKRLERGPSAKTSRRGENRSSVPVSRRCREQRPRIPSAQRPGWAGGAGGPYPDAGVPGGEGPPGG
jgi:transposase